MRLAVERNDSEGVGVLVEDYEIVLVLDELEFIRDAKRIWWNQKNKIE